MKLIRGWSGNLFAKTVITSRSQAEELKIIFNQTHKIFNLKTILPKTKFRPRATCKKMYSKQTWLKAGKQKTKTRFTNKFQRLSLFLSSKDYKIINKGWVFKISRNPTNFNRQLHKQMLASSTIWTNSTGRFLKHPILVKMLRTADSTTKIIIIQKLHLHPCIKNNNWKNI